MNPIAALKLLLKSYFETGLTAYAPLETSEPVDVPSFAEWGSLGVYLDDVPSTLEDGQKPAAAGPDLVIYNSTDCKPQYSTHCGRWLCPLDFDLTLPGDTLPANAELYWAELTAALMGKLHPDEPEDQIRAPLTDRLNSLSADFGVWIQDCIDWKLKEAFSQLESGGLTRSISVTIIAQIIPN